MLICLLLILINNFNLSYESKELPQFGSIGVTSNEQIYLSTSIYQKGDIVEISIEFNNSDLLQDFKIPLCFDNELNFSKTVNKSDNGWNRNYDSSSGEYKYIFYFWLIMDDNYKYLLIIINNEINNGILRHLNKQKPNPDFKVVEIQKYGSVTVNNSSNVYLFNNFGNEDYAYFSFSFESNINNLKEYKIYSSINSKNDEKAFQNLIGTELINPRKKNDTYTFYYKFYLYNKIRKYLCLKPGDVDGKINITNIPKLPNELTSHQKLYVYPGTFLYIDLNKYRNGKELYLQLITTTEKIDYLSLKYKFSEESFYEDFNNMQLNDNFNIKKNYNDNDLHVNTIFYFTFKIENEYNFFLIETPNDYLYISLTEGDEYQKMSDSELIAVILTSILTLVVFGTFIIAFIRICKSKKKKETNDNKEDDLPTLNDLIEGKNKNSETEENNTMSGPYDNEIVKSIN